MTCFRTCSTCLSRSQAPLCHYTHCAIADRAEGTFVLLRYALGGDRPSQTTRHTRSLDPIQGPRLDHHILQGGISLMAPLSLARKIHSLPPMLHSNT
jgi:hypothetical protein